MSDRNIFREWKFLLGDAMDRVAVTVDELHATTGDARTQALSDQEYRLRQALHFMNQMDGELRQHEANRDHELELMRQMNPIKRLLTWLSHELRYLMGHSQPSK